MNPPRLWGTALGFALGIAGPIALPLLAESLTGPPPPQRRVYLPQTFVDASEALDRYLADKGRVPSQEEGLAALVPDYLAELPLDPWSHQPYVYEPAADGQSAELLSYGADGKPGGEGMDADLSLRALSMGPPIPPPESSGTWIVNASFLLTPLLGFAGAYRWRLAAGALSGAACFTGLLLVTVALARVTAVAGLVVASATAVITLASGVLVLRQRRGARPLAIAATIIAWAQLSLLAA